MTETLPNLTIVTETNPRLIIDALRREYISSAIATDCTDCLDVHSGMRFLLTGFEYCVDTHSAPHGTALLLGFTVSPQIATYIGGHSGDFSTHTSHHCAANATVTRAREMAAVVAKQHPELQVAAVFIIELKSPSMFTPIERHAKTETTLEKPGLIIPTMFDWTLHNDGVTLLVERRAGDESDGIKHVDPYSARSRNGRPYLSATHDCQFPLKDPDLFRYGPMSDPRCAAARAALTA